MASVKMLDITAQFETVFVPHFLKIQSHPDTEPPHTAPPLTHGP